MRGFRHVVVLRSINCGCEVVMSHGFKRLGAGALLALTVAGASGQAFDPAPMIAAQREAMKPLAAMNGLWRGDATTTLPNGERRTVTQTERIGHILGGTLKIIEGRGYDRNGSLAFSAFGVVSFNPATQSYSLRSYAHGRQGDFPFRPTADGYTWDVPAWPGAIVRYTATIAGSRLQEVGDRIVGSEAPVRVFEMTLERIGDTDWPESGAIGPR
jgi:hypothetical protein